MTYINVLNNSGTFLDEDGLKQLNEATQGVGMYLQLLRSRAKKAKQMLWWIQPKAHYMQHIPEEAKLINPRVVTCYIEESFIGKVAKVWISSKNGPLRRNHPRTSPTEVLSVASNRQRSVVTGRNSSSERAPQAAGWQKKGMMHACMLQQSHACCNGRGLQQWQAATVAGCNSRSLQQPQAAPAGLSPVVMS